MRAITDGAAFFITCAMTPRSSRPFARRAPTNSWLMISSTLARTSRLTTPMGISDRVNTGKIRCFTCSHVRGKPSGPIPWAGSAFRVTANIATRTMPTQ